MAIKMDMPVDSEIVKDVAVQSFSGNISVHTSRKIALAVLMIVPAISVGIICRSCAKYEPKWSEHEIVQSKAIGQWIAASLESYRVDNGCYPPRLESLVSNYLQIIPNPTAGIREWRYRVSADGLSCELAFGKNKEWYPAAILKIGAKQYWQMDN